MTNANHTHLSRGKKTLSNTRNIANMSFRATLQAGWMIILQQCFFAVCHGASCLFYLLCYLRDGMEPISIPTRCRVQISPKVSHKPWYSKLSKLIKNVFLSYIEKQLTYLNTKTHNISTKAQKAHIDKLNNNKLHTTITG